MTISKTLELILKRLGAIEETLEATSKAVGEIGADVEDLKSTVTQIEAKVDEIDTEFADDVQNALDALADAERRRERAEWLTSARAAIGRSA